MVSRVAERLSFAKIPEVLPLPDLLAVQHESFRWFLEEGFQEIFDEISPIEDFTGSLALELVDHRFGDPSRTIEEAKERDENYSRPLHVTARFVNRETGEIKEQQVFLGDFPLMTDKGVFIINGTERVVVSQLVRSPGVYFDVNRDKTSDALIYASKIIPGRGAWLEFDTDKRGTIGVRVDRKRRQYITGFLKALGIAETDEEILALFDGAPSIQATIERDPAQSKEEALLDLYRKLRPGEPTTVESARGLIQTLFRNTKRYDLTRVGRYKVNTRFGHEVPENYRLEGQQLLSDDDIIDTIKYLVALHAGDDMYKTTAGVDVPVGTDDIDHFGNRRIRTVGELIQNQIRVGLTRLERVVRERMTTQDPEAITPQSLINIRPVTAAIKEFFGTSQLSQFMDQPNPLAGLTHRRRLSALGPGGLSRERAGFEVRDVHPSHYGRMCPIETPEGSQYWTHRLAFVLCQGEPFRVHRNAVPQGGQGGTLRRRSTTSPRLKKSASLLLRLTLSWLPTIRSPMSVFWSAGPVAKLTMCWRTPLTTWTFLRSRWCRSPLRSSHSSSTTMPTVP